MAKRRAGVYQEEVLDSARALSELDESIFGKIIATIAILPPNLSVARAIKGVESFPEGLSVEQLQDVLTLAFSVKNFSERSRRTIPLIIDEIIDEANLGDKGERFRRHLTSLLDDHYVRRWQKALSLVANHEKILLDAKLITDTRAVYTDEPDQEPDAFVMFHMLRLTYKEDFEQKETYVALDSDDLFELKKNVERAIKKRSSIASKIAQTGATLFDMLS